MPKKPKKGEDVLDEGSDRSMSTVDDREDLGGDAAAADDDRPPLPVAGFGSARYGILGAFDLSTITADPKDACERWTQAYRYVHGIYGRDIHSLSANESHVIVLLDHDGEGEGGRLVAHGLANLGRLGIGNARKENKSLFKRMRVKGRKKKDEDEEEESDLPDFSSLDKEPDPDDMKGEDTRFTAKPTKIALEKVMCVSAGREHGACICSEGEVYVWGSARHGRLGIGEAATDSSLPFDELDANDTYVARPTMLELKAVKMSSIACGHKHTIASDAYGVCYSWGSARYGKLGLGRDVSHLPLEPPDEKGAQDPYSHHALTPQKIASFGTVRVAEVFAGPYTSFALHRSDNQPSVIFAWGLARYGLLGVGESPAHCCWTERFDKSIPAEDCKECKKHLDTTKMTENTVFVEGRIGHTPFSRVRVSEPSELQRDVLLESDEEDAFDKFIPYPVEVPAMASLNIATISCGAYHNVAISKSSQIYSWGLLRHGRCGTGKFDPESKFNVRANKVIYDRSVKTFAREERFDIDFKGKIKVSVHDKNSWYLPAPKLVEGMQSKKVEACAAGELHSAAVTADGRLYTWGCARHARLGTPDKWDDLLMDPDDPEGRYRAEPAEVHGLKVGMVACTACSTLVVAKQGVKNPPWLDQQIEDATKKRGFFASVFASTSAIKGKTSAKVADEELDAVARMQKEKDEDDAEDDDDNKKKNRKGCPVM
uniref:Uncharacterized protein n=1 Tax=Hemiselmis andersenii TaxID=464988 RepID=A0A6U4L1T8_HEMAN|mmetsp:Transcript_7280/g.17562  ORF Transcript_7280/g.17562 Transcript_7280/m.17562 type:complete len:713 (+) Transcript_7280:398-2536(+)|eukprot:CAMPEP_0169427654 /NCGR_PEP_ID=MMETSP1042-20121227/895_1 /TAXON_ID=464988 /ORGANISM="Hemiselmis andersenii, Strain CCMP1180" /LENGTH=712 /DNA_ID=CAMNT_0009537745 /DNA_START=355 /DNA_END=2493 /DNA_ORIENTATION=+